MKNLLFLVCLAPAIGQASYELALVADNTASALSVGSIHRFDPSSGAYLGAFGHFANLINDIAADQSTGDVFAIDTGGAISRYDYSSGLLEQSIVVAGFMNSINLVGSELWVQSGSQISRFSKSLNLLGTISLAASGTVRSICRSGSSIYADESIGGFDVFRKYTLSGAFVSAQGSLSIVGTPGKIGTLQYLSTGNTELLTFGTGTTNTTSYCILNGETMVSSGTYSPSLGTLYKDSAALHSGGVYIGRDVTDTTKGIVTLVSSSGGTVYGSFGQSVLKNPVAVTTIVAPEPGALSILALGGIALVRRKK